MYNSLILEEVYLEVKEDQLYASWPNLESVESDEFYHSVLYLFNLIRDRGITKVIIDSGQPQGGVLSEKIINYGLQVVPLTNLRKVAILESSDFHWDNNLLQLINYLKFTLQFPIEGKIVADKLAALEWFN